ncbi:hypothetical protein NYR60_05325 [Actinobacillus genomosp. 2]|uniref:hypothetical protein n=1 Tax=Actinobacillus genomosp. 2 TaxID=230709 RepID=UPI002442052F|nr:hypothetical protein [Actinobacillus genomosp. 2]WGE31294.1 hypothetical protein NYR60_05325 [Actinobacillus genomosp. 2]
MMVFVKLLGNLIVCRSNVFASLFMRDGYLEFFKKFNISEDDFLNFAHSSIILIPKDKAKIEWEKLKDKISKKNELVYVRSYARNGSKNHLYQNFYKTIFNCNLEIDPSNNTYPTRLLENLTGYTKKGSNANLRNYQVSHIFGSTKNPYLFCSPWNIAFIPKILDPFTGHESKGELTHKITRLYKEMMWDNYENLINDYNKLMSELKEKIDQFIEQDNKENKKFHDSIRSEFSKIERE